MSAGDEWLRRWREYFLAWYDLGRVEEKAAEAAEFASQFLDDGMVSVSGGKDSLTMLHIIASRCRPDPAVFHWDHGAWLMPRQVEDEIIAAIRSVAPSARLIIRQYSRGWHELARFDWRPWYREFFATLASLGYRHHLRGIRRDESCSRAARGRIVRRDKWVEVHPIYEFTWRDVWAYVFRRNIPFPRIYEERARLVGWENARLVTFFDREMEARGSTAVDKLTAWRHMYPG